MNNDKMNKGRIRTLIQILSLLPIDEILNDLQKSINVYEKNNSDENLEKVEQENSITAIRLRIENKGLETVMKEAENVEMMSSLQNLDSKVN